MKKLDSLIRIHRHHVEQRQQALSEIAARKKAALAHLAALEAEIEREAANAGGIEGGAAFYAAYAQAARLRRETIARTVAGYDLEASAARALLQEAFEALKKYELVDEATKAKLKREEARKEQQALDEAASVRVALRR
ncbi:MAG: hypothetical protein Tsb0010_07680 [Parvularculaceae bacterium]